MKISDITIAAHWDTGGIIGADADAAREFAIWQAYAAADAQGWSGYEFTVSDFERHIANLKA